MNASEINPVSSENDLAESDNEKVSESLPAPDKEAESDCTGEVSDRGEACEEEPNDPPKKDYAQLAKDDMLELKRLFPALHGKESITEIDNPLRYAALRDLGLTPKEAYLATNAQTPAYDNRSHLRSAVPRGAATANDMLDSRALEAARELFSGLSDREIQRLYKKVSK